MLPKQHFSLGGVPVWAFFTFCLLWLPVSPLLAIMSTPWWFGIGLIVTAMVWRLNPERVWFTLLGYLLSAPLGFFLLTVVIMSLSTAIRQSIHFH